MGMATALGDVEQALRDYERARSARTAGIVRVAKRNAVIGSLTARLSIWMRDAVLPHLPERLMLKTVVDMGRPLS